MIIIDSNSLILLLIGCIDEELIANHKRTSIFTKQDYHNLLYLITDIKEILVLPNIWTEVDNLLNRFSGNYKWPYITEIRKIISQTTENYLSSKTGVDSMYFENIGLTDSLILELAKDCELLITSDSVLSDFASANGIMVYDMVQMRNKEFNR